MAYLSKEDTKEIRERIKSHFGKDFKFSVTNEHHTSICVYLLSSPIPFDKEYSQVNHYYIQESLKENPEMANVMNKVYELITCVKECYDRNAGDPSADYGDNNYFINIGIGKWDKPYIWTGVEKKAA